MSYRSLQDRYAAQQLDELGLDRCRAARAQDPESLRAVSVDTKLDLLLDLGVAAPYVLRPGGNDAEEVPGALRSDAWEARALPCLGRRHLGAAIP